jgi:hypothetical protein
MANFIVQTEKTTDRYEGEKDSYTIEDGVLMVWAMDRPKPVLIIVPLHLVVRVEDFDVGEPSISSVG